MRSRAEATGRDAVAIGDAQGPLGAISLRLTRVAACFRGALEIAHALDAAPIGSTHWNMTNFTLTAHFSFGRFGAFTDLNITAYVGILIALLTFTAGKLREVVCEAAAQVFNASVRGRMAPLTRRTVTISSAGRAHAGKGLTTAGVVVA